MSLCHEQLDLRVTSSQTSAYQRLCYIAPTLVEFSLDVLFGPEMDKSAKVEKC